MKRFFKALLADTVSLILLLLCIIMVVGYFVKGINFTPFLAIMALNVIFNVNEKSIFIESLQKSNLNLKGILPTPVKREKSIFEKIVLAIIMGGGVVIMVLIAKSMIF